MGDCVFVNAREERCGVAAVVGWSVNKLTSASGRRAAQRIANNLHAQCAALEGELVGVWVC